MSPATPTAPRPAKLRGWFQGAVLPVCGLETLVIVVQPWVLTNIHEANLFAFAFHAQYHRPIVLVSQDVTGQAHFYGPAPLARALRALPLPVIPWRRFRYRPAPQPRFLLPIPIDPPDTADIADLSADGTANLTADGTPAPARATARAQASPAPPARDLRELHSESQRGLTCALDALDEHTTRR